MLLETKKLTSEKTKTQQSTQNCKQTLKMGQKQRFKLIHKTRQLQCDFQFRAF